MIDITPLRDGSDPGAVAEKLLDTSQNIGFIYVSGHGIPQSVIDSARASAYEFFRSNDAQKARYKINDRHRGWLPRGGAVGGASPAACPARLRSAGPWLAAH